MLIHNGIAIIERDTHISKWVIEHNRLDFDQNQLPTYFPYFKPNGYFVNIGANIGCYALPFIKQAKEAHLFEPNKEAFECLEYNMDNYDNVNLYNFGISDKESSCKVLSDNDNAGMVYLKEDEGGQCITRTIDSFNFKGCDFILMDCEGFELKALIGAKETIYKYKPIMVIEINDATLNRQGITRNDIFAWLRENNYIYRNIYKNQGLEDSQLDIICEPI